ncbi:MAG: class I SAM-dependent methyltransferase [Xanthobacteraceae bacterium]|jgi:SAM-dependent methyltransferase
MAATHYRRDTCRLCGSRNLEIVLHYEPTPPADAYLPANQGHIVQESYPLDLYLCQDCGFSQLCDVLRADSIYVDYIYETKSSLGLVDHFRRYANSVLDRIQPPRGALVVDLGSNDGTLLRPFKERGMNVLGVDPAREIAHDATASGIETWPEFFTADLSRKIRKQRGGASIVTANNIYANVDELGEFTDNIRSLLGSDGVFIFESFYLGDLIENLVFDFIYHEHLSSFSVTPLAGFFRRHGMELIDAERVPTKGGSLRYTVQLEGGPRNVSKTVTDLLAEEEQRGLGRMETFRSFSTRIEAAKKELRNQLDKLKREGKAIAGYGASATTTTLVYHFGLGDYLDYLVDEYDRKQNTLMPGLHLPVLAPEVLQKRKTDYVVILAWRYVQPILDKNRAFREQGGKFIVPLPKLQII